ncbi:UNVERIFIED_CONTAM: hypothetical protein Slati_3899100 [Sesamum latifolium]|uniref:Uncharacterized protein n=1 Tax=Sesamum latifolium TaxID=2727402 RepID=A0AAW2TMM1_9LAMI
MNIDAVRARRAFVKEQKCREHELAHQGAGGEGGSPGAVTSVAGGRSAFSIDILESGPPWACAGAPPRKRGRETPLLLRLQLPFLAVVFSRQV